MAVAAQLHNWGASREQHDTTAEELTNDIRISVDTLFCWTQYCSGHSKGLDIMYSNMNGSILTSIILNTGVTFDGKR